MQSQLHSARFWKRCFSSAKNVRQEKVSHPTASDVIYKNPEAMVNRLHLFHLMRLHVQYNLDLQNFRDLAAKHPPTMELRASKDKKLVRVTTQYHSGEPGCAKQFDPAAGTVKVKIPTISMGLDQVRLEDFLNTRKDIKLTEAGRYLVITMGNCPFQTQNKIEVSKLVQELIKKCKKEAAAVELSELKSEKDNEEEYIQRPKTRPKLRFPFNWLTADRQVKRNSQAN